MYKEKKELIRSTFCILIRQTNTHQTMKKTSVLNVIYFLNYQLTFSFKTYVINHEVMNQD